SKSQIFMRDMAADAVQNLGTAITSAAFQDRLPTSEDLAANVITMFGSGVGAGTKARISRKLNSQMSAIETLRTQVAANMANSVIAGVSAEAGELARTGTGDLTAVDIA